MPQVVVLEPVDSGWRNIPTLTPVHKHKQVERMAIQQQNPYISLFSKLTGFLRLCFSLERRTPVVDAGPTREHLFFTQVV